MGRKLEFPRLIKCRNCGQVIYADSVSLKTSWSTLVGGDPCLEGYKHAPHKDTELQMLETLAEETLPAELDPDQKESDE